jgi:hypothetical protein
MKIRQNVQRISHIVLMVRPENHDKAVADLTNQLGAEFLTKEFQHLSVRCSQSWENGFEVLSPFSLDDDTEYARWLKNNDEGFHSVVFGVDDIGKAEERAAAAGANFAVRYDAAPCWPEFFETLEETRLEPPVHGMTLIIGELRPRPEVLDK